MVRITAIGLPNVEVYALPRTMRWTIHLTSTACWGGFEGCHVLTVPSTPVSQFISGLGLFNIKSKVVLLSWSLLSSPFISIFRRMCRWSRKGNCCGVSMCGNQPHALGLLSSRPWDRSINIGLRVLLQGSSVHQTFLHIAVTGLNGAHLLKEVLMNNWLPYR